MNALQKQDLIDMGEGLTIEDLLRDDMLEFVSDEVKQRFHVTDLQSATWCMRKMQAINAQLAEVKKVADEEMNRIMEWFEAEKAKVERSLNFFTGLLHEYHLQEITKDPKKKTISTPYGKLQMKKSQPKWDYNEERLLQWMKDNGYNGFIRLKEEPNKADFKKALQVKDGRAFDENGQAVEGITVIEQPDSFKVEVQ